MKDFVKRLFQRFGLDVRYAYKHDAVEMQRRLLAGRDVTTVFDVGAYHGEWIETYRRLFPSPHVFAFEPFPESREILTNKFGRESGITVCAAAVGDATSERTFYANRHAATNSLLLADHQTDSSMVSSSLAFQEPLTVKSELVVPVVTIDSFCQEHSINRINALKIDVQGAETLVLCGAAGMLRRKAIDLVYTELQIMHYYEGQSNYFDVCAYLHGAGYDLFGLYNFAVNPKGRFGWCDAIFLPRS